MLKHRNFLHKWHAKNAEGNPLRNPLFPHRACSTRRKLITVIGAGTLFIGGLFALVMLLPFFQVSGVVIEGLTSISRDDVTHAVDERLSSKSLFVLPGRHRLLIDEDDIARILSEQFLFKSVNVTYDGKTMVIFVEERVLEIALRSADKTYFLTLEGAISREASVEESLALDVRLGKTAAPEGVTLPSLQPTMPIIQLGQLDVTETLGLDRRIVSGVIAVDEGLRAIDVLPISHEVIRLSDRWITTHTQAGYDVMIDVTKDIADQLETLKTILGSRDDARYEYIDVRFGEHVFVKEL